MRSVADFVFDAETGHPGIAEGADTDAAVAVLHANHIGGERCGTSVDGRHLVIATAQAEIPTLGSGMRRCAQSHRRSAGQSQHANFHCSTLAKNVEGQVPPTPCTQIRYSAYNGDPAKSLPGYDILARIAAFFRGLYQEHVVQQSQNSGNPSRFTFCRTTKFCRTIK